MPQTQKPTKKTDLVLPPQNIDAEEAFLGAVLSDSSSLDKVIGIIKPSDFYEIKYGKIFETCLKLYENNSPIDAVTVRNEMQKDKNFNLDEIEGTLSFLVSQVPSIANAYTYAKIIHEKSILRNLISVSRDVATIALSEGMEIEEILDMAERKIFEVSQNQSIQKMVQVKDALETAFDRIESMHREPGKLRGLKTGFDDLDNLTSGLQKGDFIIIAARPSMGKSTFALDLVRNISTKQKTPVAMFMLEMSTDQVIDKFIASSGHIDLWRMRTGKLRDEDYEKIAMAFEELNSAPIFIDDSLTTNVMDIRSKCRRLKSEQGSLGMIVIDYLQLLEGTHKDNRVQEVSEISRQLKMLAKELDVPVVALSQLSRSLESRPDKRPILSDLRESGSIEQDADIVAFIYRDAYYRRNDDSMTEEEKHIAEIILAKHRNGPTGMIKLYFDENEVSFKNLNREF
ncbi:MAG: replicative DNA helicase [Patescibacteria group bacterium]